MILCVLMKPSLCAHVCVFEPLTNVLISDIVVEIIIILVSRLKNKTPDVPWTEDCKGLWGTCGARLCERTLTPVMAAILSHEQMICSLVDAPLALLKFQLQAALDLDLSNSLTSFTLEFSHLFKLLSESTAAWKGIQVGSHLLLGYKYGMCYSDKFQVQCDREVHLWKVEIS